MLRFPLFQTVLAVTMLAGLHVARAAQPVAMSDLVEAKAIVESVDLTSRMVLLRGDHGDLQTIYVSPAVKNLAQVHPGDYVLVSLHRSVMLQMSKPGSPPVASVEGTAATAMPGAKPSAFRTETVHARVQITGIDLDNKTVSFVGPAGIPRVVQINDSRVLDFVRTLHVGDQVDVTYSVGVAASVVPARG